MGVTPETGKGWRLVPLKGNKRYCYVTNHRLGG